MDRLTEVQRSVNGEVRRLSVSSLATLYGCCGLLDMCGDADLMSLSFAGAEPFLDVLGWTPSNVCRIRKSFIPWVRPEYSQGVPTGGYLSDPCADPNGVEFSTCDFQLEDFGRLRRAGPTRDITKAGLKLCETQPRYRWDGSPITDDMEFGMRLAMEAIMQDLKRYIISGNAATPGLFSGLNTLIDSTYYDPNGVRCCAMDSIVIDWNSNPFSGGAGITWNGAAVGATFDLIDVLLAVYRRIKTRISWAPPLAAQGLRLGDQVLVAPTNLIQCLLDAFTCWSVCPGAQYNEVNLNTLEARTFRDRLNGGLFGAGRIFLDGFEIPLIAYDWGTNYGTNRGDMYFLTLKAGNVRLLEGQFNDMRAIPDITGLPSGVKVVTDGGRLLTWVVADHTCMQNIVEMQPRLLMWAPWAQARIMDVRCAGVVGPISPDPTESSYAVECASVIPAACP